MTPGAVHVAGAHDRPAALPLRPGDADGPELEPRPGRSSHRAVRDLDVRPPARPGRTAAVDVSVAVDEADANGRLARELSTVLSRAWGGRW
jgi:hypothetical protein